MREWAPPPLGYILSARLQPSLALGARGRWEACGGVAVATDGFCWDERGRLGGRGIGTGTDVTAEPPPYSSWRFGREPMMIPSLQFSTFPETRQKFIIRLLGSHYLRDISHQRDISIAGLPSARQPSCATFQLRDISTARYPICASSHLRDIPFARHPICATTHLRDFSFLFTFWKPRWNSLIWTNLTKPNLCCK